MLTYDLRNIASWVLWRLLWVVICLAVILCHIKTILLHIFQIFVCWVRCKLWAVVVLESNNTVFLKRLFLYWSVFKVSAEWTFVVLMSFVWFFGTIWFKFWMLIFALSALTLTLWNLKLKICQILGKQVVLMIIFWVHDFYFTWRNLVLFINFKILFKVKALVFISFNGWDCSVLLFVPFRDMNIWYLMTKLF